MRVSVLGAGSWGTALSIHFARVGHETLLWGRDADTIREIRERRRHPHRLEGIAVPDSISVGSDLEAAFRHADTIVLAVPCASFRGLLKQAPPPDRKRRFVSAAKGIEPETLKRMSEIVLEYQPGAAVTALSGPTFADEVARGEPSAAVIAGGAVAADLQSEFSSSELRLYRSDDITGVELCGALKNVVAIAAGIVSGLGYGHNTLAALVTRGLAEIARVVRVRGGDDRTVHGLAGMGDLLLTCTGRLSRNRGVGEEIGRGRPLSDVLVEMPEVAEGVRTCLAFPTLAAQGGVEAPIARAVFQVLYEGLAPGAAIGQLMTRSLKTE